MLASQYIPGGAFVSVPFRATHHDPRNFSPEPSTWRPDRWITPEKEQVMNQKACAYLKTVTHHFIDSSVPQSFRSPYAALFERKRRLPLTTSPIDRSIQLRRSSSCSPRASSVHHDVRAQL